MSKREKNHGERPSGARRDFFRRLTVEIDGADRNQVISSPHAIDAVIKPLQLFSIQSLQPKTQGVPVIVDHW